MPETCKETKTECAVEFIKLQNSVENVAEKLDNFQDTVTKQWFEAWENRIEALESKVYEINRRIWIAIGGGVVALFIFQLVMPLVTN